MTNQGYAPQPLAVADYPTRIAALGVRGGAVVSPVGNRAAIHIRLTHAPYHAPDSMSALAARTNGREGR